MSTCLVERARICLQAIYRMLAIFTLLSMAMTAGEAVAQQHAYVANARSNTISVIDESTNVIATTIAVGAGPVSIAILPDGTRVYVANSISNNLSVIDTTSNTVVATIPVGLGPVSIAFTPGGGRAYVANARAQSVSVIDTGTLKVIATVQVGNQPNKVAVSPDGTSVYVTNGADNSVSVIATATNTVKTTVGVGKIPFDVVTPFVPPAPTCTDNMQNGQETDIDCGGPACPKCGLSRRCLIDSDCASNHCVNNMMGPPTCQP
ncbi:YncE family protein [Burkholderia stagnalis]|uniref:YncE family protein n=1 Tax=Burkholderia stagnalis TaxID=1503054 RepID=UPI0009C16A2C|nr:YncE family protein [Burkholderia stagnalis]